MSASSDSTPDFPAPLRPLIARFPGSRIREVSDAGFGIEGVIPLWFGESDRSTPAFICEAATRAMTQGHTFYTPNRGIPELRQTIAQYVSGLRGRPIGADRVSVTASGVSAIMLVMEALVDPGSSVALVGPIWPNCADSVTALGGEVRRVPLEPTPQGWRLDLDRLFDACDDTTRAIFVNSPGNPTGWLMKAEEVRAILAFCRKRRIWAIGDDVYDRLVYDRPVAPSFLDLAGPEDPVIAINSFSKAWCMTGWRLGWLVAPPAFGEVIGKINEFNVSSATTFVQHAGITAIRDGEPFVAEIVAQYARARDLVVQRLGAMPRVRLVRPEAAFYAFFTVDGMSDSLAFAKHLIAETKVGLAPGIAFGQEGEGWLRLCFATSLARLGEAMDRLEPALS